jgi:hypothetical protein
LKTIKLLGPKSSPIRILDEAKLLENGDTRMEVPRRLGTPEKIVSHV